jgi:hypothetical protein
MPGRYVDQTNITKTARVFLSGSRISRKIKQSLKMYFNNDIYIYIWL